MKNLLCQNQQFETQPSPCNYSVLIPAPTFYLPGSKDLYTIPFDKAVPIIKKLGFGRPYTPLPLCIKCRSDVATHSDAIASSVCDKCYNILVSSLLDEKYMKKKNSKPYKPRNNKICSTCGSRRGTIKNGRKYKTCEECLVKKKEERLKRLQEDNFGTVNILNDMNKAADEA